ncbi:hypothetical protein [Chitinophaga nivalis]|uniref:Uncharacterized protein n=1 Tax=Chitinophaga nivalis TaxID=2991709 RepID=A0ABT3ITK7_9BACT|nr:hypothetical protein [Chitinophaga nivalis]MCW3463060.1 hypothetical protein [Chitinophaga nivalis]MCW3487250.1 hypothetical protein [Chitinophaga nivalis]
MIFTIGTIALGQVKRYNKFYIETRFFTAPFPIKAKETLLVDATDPNHVKKHLIRRHRQSVIAGFIRMPAIMAAVVLILLAGERQSIPLAGCAAGISLIAIYFQCFYGRPTADEKREMLLLGKLAGIYAVAAWFETTECEEFYEELVHQYRSKFAGADWKMDLLHQQVRAANIPLLYGLTLFNALLDPSPGNIDLRNKAQQHYAALGY